MTAEIKIAAFFDRGHPVGFISDNVFIKLSRLTFPIILYEIIVKIAGFEISRNTIKYVK
jgi:hypothetical protein